MRNERSLLLGQNYDMKQTRAQEPHNMLDTMIDSDRISPDISRLIKEEPLTENANKRTKDELKEVHIPGSHKNDARYTSCVMTDEPALYIQKSEEGRLHCPPIRSVPHKNLELSSARVLENVESLLLSSVKNSHVCNNCGRTFTSPKDLKNHERFPCGDGLNDSKSMVALAVKKCKNIDVFECNACDRSFTSYKGFQIHKAFCKIGSKPCCCDELGIPCSFKSSNNNHQGNSLNSLLPFCCCVCGKYFQLKKRLKVHMVIHSDERLYYCDECSLGFRRRKNLLSHLVVHDNVNPHICSVCWKYFRTRNSLRQHMITHSRKKPFTCDECGKAFKTRSGIAEHCQTHIKVLSFTCSSCPRSFKSRWSLYEHRNYAHSGTRRYTCNRCSHILFSRKTLVRHLAKCSTGR
ncbi:gastrula zinc finger protein XlCGF46.1-like isoform X2 [Anabrus simplex]|uniref:gastrula zinc finger protein XlCGF46.1-like isoform X2 n=1 Tax=Anabrus simplex TaxID=316456 RepID=UPI0035A306B6